MLLPKFSKIFKISPFAVSMSLSLLFYLVSLVIASNDLDFSYRWLTFTLWIISVLLLPAVLIVNKASRKKGGFRQFLSLDKTDIAPLIFIGFWTTLLSFILLVNYPFVAVYDQIRDGGLNAQQIVNGSIKNIFAYGRYESHGLIIPTITGFFYLIFKNSVLTFRFPGALIAVLDVLMIYWICRRTVGKRAAFWSALILINLPLYLYYSRTEIVPFFSSLLTSLILLLLSFFFQRKSFQAFALLGLLLGFSSGFHTSIRTIALLTAIIVITLALYDVLIRKINKKAAIGILLMVVFFFIGFGPRVLFTTPNIFFQTRSLRNLSFVDSTKGVITNKEFLNNSSIDFGKIVNNYEKSLLVYFREPTRSTHYADLKPLLDPILGIFFVVGFLSAIFISKSIFLRIVCLFALLIPLTNSAITEAINSDNRLLPLLPVSAILAGYGIQITFSKISNLFKLKNWTTLFLGITLIIYILFQGCKFFWNESASKQYSGVDYLSMYTVYFLKSNTDYQNFNKTCLFVSPTNFKYFNLLHVKEQYQYFVPNKLIQVFENNGVRENQIYISGSCNKNLMDDNFTVYQYCQNQIKFVCPKGTDLTLLVETKSN